jgi:hypothetical protein
MKQNICAVISEFLVLSAVVASNGAPLVVADELAVKTMNGVSYASGGFGIDERQRLRSLAKGDNLELSFALATKEYLDGADLAIKDGKGATVLETVSDGPLFYARLPEGSYTVAATALGKTLIRKVQVPAKGQARVHFAWHGANELISQSVVQR